MKYTGITYRPPPEANALLLQVTAGCAHNDCTYCTMYTDVQFKIEKIDQIEKDLEEAKKIYGPQKRIFLVNGDAFVLSAKKLKKISEKIIEYFPMMEAISMYSSKRNIMTKTDVEHTHFASNHYINTVSVQGFLPREKKRLISTIDRFIETTDESFLNSITARSSV